MIIILKAHHGSAALWCHKIASWIQKLHLHTCTS